MGSQPAPIPNLSLCDGLKREELNTRKIVDEWLAKLQGHFSEKSFGGLSNLFIDDCWWRDLVGLTWDTRTKHGLKDIEAYLTGAPHQIHELKSHEAGPLQPSLFEQGGLAWIQSVFSFKTPNGNGRGLVRLANVGEYEWKAWTVFTQLERLDLESDVEAQSAQTSAAEPDPKAADGADGVDGHAAGQPEEVQVLIVGAGHSGLMLAARLGKMGIRALLVDKHARLGESWRNRYKTITLHTPKYSDHYPFMNYPEEWPKWLPRDMVADFAEQYGQAMGLNVRLSTTVAKVEYVESTGRYRVEVQGPNGLQVLSPRHLVLATGIVGDEPVVPQFVGQELFKGELYHSDKHQSAENTPGLSGKRIVVVGPSTSGHDVAQDFVTTGAKEVTMIQRHPIFFISPNTLETLALKPWDTEGISIEDADLMAGSLPMAVFRTMSLGLTHVACKMDEETITGLKKAGLGVKTGEDGVSLTEYQLIRFGHFYSEQGASKMIIDGQIKVRQCEGGIQEFDENGIVLADGSRIEADVVVLATGYHRSARTVERIMGKDFAKELTAFGDLDDEQERRGWWRKTGIPGFWFMTGNFSWSRFYSRALALQIAAVEHGLNTTYY